MDNWIKISTSALLITFLGSIPMSAAFAQVQGFEESFDIQNHPDEFLPLWSANEVRPTSSRVFRAIGKGRRGSHALGIQPLSSYEGVIYQRVVNAGKNAPKLAFFARTEPNGTGNRPAMLTISFAKEGESSFVSEIQIGDSETFPNKNTAFRLFEIPIPSTFSGEKNFTIKWSIKVGLGTGSTARLFIDDVGIWEMEDLVDPVQIISATLLNPYWAELVSDRPLEAVMANQTSLANQVPYALLQPADTLIWLESALPLEDRTFEIELFSLSDRSGNITPEISLSVSNEKIKIGRLLPISPVELLVEFTQPFNPASVSQTGKFLINGKSPSGLELLESGFGLHVQLSEELLPGKQYTIEVSSLESAWSGLTNMSLRKSPIYIDGLKEIRAEHNRGISLVFLDSIEAQQISTPDFQFRENTDITFTIDSIGSNSLYLSTNADLEEEKEYVLEIPPIQTRRGYTLPGLWKSVIWDSTPPELVHVLPVEASKLLLMFSEDLDPAFALNPEAYQIGGESPTQVELQASPDQVLLTWMHEFVDANTYELIVTGVYDARGNSLERQIFSFTYEKSNPLPFKALVINEVMPAPRAGNLLPNTEYVEIFNASESPIYLGGVQLANSRRSSLIPPYSLGPRQTLLLCARTQAQNFTNVENLLGLGSWPSLLNSGDNIRLLTDAGEVIDSLSYTSASWGGSAFSTGGYSLEIANPFLQCNISTNLKVSLAPERGTPGRQNSVFDPNPDLTPLRYLESSVVSERKIILSFSKTLQANLSDLDLQIDPHIGILKTGRGAQPDELVIELTEDLSQKVLYILSIDNLRDCTGNPLEADQEIKFALPSAPIPGDVVINEVLFNPRTGAPKFVEVYNASEKFINLKDWKLANLEDDGNIGNRRIVFQTDYILAPRSFLVFTNDPEILKTEYSKGQERRFVKLTLPSYPIQSGDVVWLDPTESIQETFSYDESMHHGLLKETKGVSLERSSPWLDVTDRNNWRSAASTENFATPGYRNSTDFEFDSNMELTVEPKVFSPDVIGSQGYTTISYRLDQSGLAATINIYSAGGALVREICQNAILGNTGIFTWDGTDQSGRRVRSGYYVLWVEFFDLNGNIRHLKRTIAVGTNL